MASLKSKRHTRTSALSATDSMAAVAAATASSSSSAPAASSAAVAEALTLDPDEFFVRMAVRDVQNVETTLRTAQNELTARLRSLVSERYRDMLGTANTLIDLSGSSSKLVERIDSVLAGIEQSEAVEGKRHSELSRGSASILSVDAQHGATNALAALVAITRLLVEAPDEVWRSLEHARALLNSASSPNLGGTSNHENSVKGKSKAPVGRQARSLAAAHVLRAAYLCALADSAWSWLTKQDLSDDINEAESSISENVAALFPYVAQQYDALEAMRPTVAAVAEQGIQGWADDVPKPKSQWQDFATSETATRSCLLSIALVQRLHPEDLFEKYLQCRMSTLKSRLQMLKSTEAPIKSLAYVLRYIADTLLQGNALFARSAPSSLNTAPSLSALDQLALSLRRRQGHNRETHDAIPHAGSLLSTMPSADLLQRSLPDSVVDAAVKSPCNSTDLAMQENLIQWTKEILGEPASTLIREAAGPLQSISMVGRAQSAVQASLQKLLQQSRGKSQLQDTDGLALYQRITDVASSLDAILDAKLYDLCERHVNRLASTFARDITVMTERLRGTDAQDTSSKNELFHSIAESASTFTGGLVFADETKISDILHTIESGTAELWQEMSAYLASSQRRPFLVERQAGKNARLARQSSLPAGAADRSGSQDVRAYFEQSILQVRQRLVETLSSATDVILSTSDTNVTGALLFLSQLAGSLQVHVADHAHSAGSLLEIEHRLLSAWADSVVGKAANEFALTPASRNGVESIDVSQSASASCEMLRALHCLVRGLQLSGCQGRQATWLRSRLLDGFIQAWVPLVTNVAPSLQLYIDAKILAALMDDEPHKGPQSKAQVSQLIQQMGSSADVSLMSKDDVARTAIARVRLILVSLAIDEDNFIKHASPGAAQGYTPAGQSSITQAPATHAASALSVGNVFGASAPSAVAGFRPLPPLHTVRSF